MKFLNELSVNGKRVLVRADLNVPLNENLQVTDDHRIREATETIKAIMEKGGLPVVIAHLGRPEGKDPAFSLRPVATKLQEILGSPVIFANDCVGDEVERLSRSLEQGQVLLLENLRFYPGEKKNDPVLSRALGRVADVFVNDSFATAHRTHASNIGVLPFFKQKAAGLVMQREIEYYEKALVNPKRPLCVILGGLKISTKLPILQNIAHKADKIIIGGAMANTFLAAQGLQMGRSKFEQEYFGKALELFGTLARRDTKLYLPVDFIVSTSPAAKGLARAVPAQEVPADLMALDIGPASSLLFKEAIQSAETIVWNGPMGAFENEEFSKGTTDMIESISQAHGLKVVGGGDTETAIHSMELEHKFDFISSGGGAFLALLEGKGLPALSALE